MTKQDLIDFVVNKTKLTKKDVTQALDAVFEGIIIGLKTSKDARLLALAALIYKPLSA